MQTGTWNILLLWTGRLVRWLYSKEKGVQFLGIEAWRTNALDRNQWKKEVEVVKAYCEL
jgi:hypothetical protein